MKNFRKKVYAIVVVLAMTMMMMPLAEMTSVHADGGTTWAESADSDWASSYTQIADMTTETFTITTAEELAQLAVKVNSGLTFKNKTIKLDANIVLNTGTMSVASTEAKPWIAIGKWIASDQQDGFSGTFEGQEHTVSGIYIDKPDDQDQGLFGISNGSIQNLGIINSYIKGKYNVGAIVGRFKNGTVKNCYNTGAVSGIASNIGGIVGVSGLAGTTITSCYNTGAVSGVGAIGGIVGYSSRKNKVEDCYNTGAVSGRRLIGGVVGENESATTSNCYNTGTVSQIEVGDGGSGGIGGVVGKNFEIDAEYGVGIVTNCYNTGAVSGTTNIGGVVGENTLGSTITNTYYTGCIVGVGNQTDASGKTTPFASIANNPLGVRNNTIIISGAADTLQGPALLGNNFSVSFAYISSSNTDIAIVSGTTITGIAAGSTTITSTMTIKQNSLISTGFTGATNDINVNLSHPLNVEEIVNAVAPSFTANLSGEATYDQNATAVGLTVTATASDSGTITYQWYKNTENNNTTGTAILDETGGTYTPQKTTVGTTYYYVIATNTNASVNGNKTATMTSGIKKIIVVVPTFTVTFQCNGGSAINPQNFASGTVIVVPYDTHRTEYAFRGWYKDNGVFEHKWDFVNDKVTENITLYAKWSYITSAQFVNNNGLANTFLSNVYVGETIQKPTDPIKAGFTLEGWYKEAIFTNKWNFETDKATSNMKLYAKFVETPAPDITPPAPVITPIIIKITAGADQTHQADTTGTLTITCSGALDTLFGIYVDDALVAPSNYSLKSGSTILTFKAEYLNSLRAGTHTLKFAYSGNDSAQTTFFVAKKDTVPKTGDTIFGFIGLFLASGAILTCVLIFSKKKKKELTNI